MLRMLRFNRQLISLMVKISKDPTSKLWLGRTKVHQVHLKVSRIHVGTTHQSNQPVGFQERSEHQC